MKLATTRSVTLIGVKGAVIDIEVHIGGMPGFYMVGLPDVSLNEARERVRAAVLSSNEEWPLQRITVNLSPAWLPKRGSQFDLGLAVAILAAEGDVPPVATDDVVYIGELALDGRVRPVRGVLSAVLAASAAGLTRVVVPAANVAEARLVPDMSVLGVRSLGHLLALMRGEPVPDEPDDETDDPPAQTAVGGETVDMNEIAGQIEAKRAVEIAAAGRHHVLFTGAPGAGKTMLATRLPGLLPDLEAGESLEVTAIHSVAGVLAADQPLVTRPPLAAPHHSASVAAVVGGGGRVIRPGAASVAHRGVLFLDEAPEFRAGVLESLRQPLESGEVAIARVEAAATLPARFQLVLAANPCKCGFHGSTERDCVCPPDTVRRYQNKISEPMRDRIDLQLSVQAPNLATFEDDLAAAEPTKIIADRVAEARERAGKRLAGSAWRVNGDVPGPVIRRRFAPSAAAVEQLHRYVQKGTLSARGADRVLRVAWTIADLEGHDAPTSNDVNEAAGLRMGRQM
ncbi:MAG TPA: YifB family Mg chelatase-like AAA ATPase [Jiangellaceae bacterium]